MFNRLIRKKYRAAIGKRFDVLCASLLPEDAQRLVFSEENLVAFCLDQSISPKLRSFIAYFSLSGSMPTESSQNEFVALLGTTSSKSVEQWLVLNGIFTSRTAQLREIHSVSAPLYDCTNVSAVEGTRSGIPRVSYSFLDEQPDLHENCFVWSDGVMGPISYRPEIGFVKSREVWPNSGGLFDISKLIRRATEWASQRTNFLRNRWLYHAFVGFGLFLSWLLVTVFRFRGPGPRVALLPLGHVWSFETVSADAVTRLVAIQQSVESVKISMMIYDLLPIQIPDNFLPIAVEHYVHQLRLMRCCKTLLTDSAHLPDILSGALAMMESKVLPEIKPQPLHINSKWLRSRYRTVPSSIHFAQIGAIETRKNHHYALAAFTRLSYHDSTYSVIGRERAVPDFIKQLIEFADSKGQRVALRHGLTDDDIISLFESVTASVCPSTAEGYGLPVLESLAMGVPVIASNISPHQQFEPIGGILYFDPTSVESLISAMNQAADPARNAQLRESIRFDRIPANSTAWAQNARLALES